MLHHLPAQDSLFNMHSQVFNGSATNLHLPSEFSGEFDPHKPQPVPPGKHNGLNGNNNYSRASFSAFPNTNRPRLQNPSVLNTTAPSFRNEPFYPPNQPDMFPNNMMSPTSAHLPPYGPGMGAEFTGTQGLGTGHKPFQDPYNGPVGVMPSHPSNNKPAFSQPQPPHTFNTPAPFMNGMHSQTPYGPHVPTPAGPPIASNQNNTNPTNNYSANKDNNSNNQEEISTIFVVGFPEDMQEREFQNMFTFSAGFEAATLKIPNKEYTAYNGISQSRSFQNFNGPNDAYNSIPQGIVLDVGRDGGMPSWASGIPGDDVNAHFMPGAAPPRKQIIGFAKFKSREEALGARDILQGRRIDIEKGAVLKAEMAKKNLHTKRGVGPLPNNPPPAVNGNHPPNNAPMMNMGPTVPPALAMFYNMTGVLNPTAPPEGVNMPPNEPFVPREREPLPSVGRLGQQWRDSQAEPPNPNNVNFGNHPVSSNNREREEEDRRREGTLNAMGFGGPRGPRERAADEEKRKEMRLRNSTAAFEAFHSVPFNAPPGLSRQSSLMNGINTNSLLPPEVEVGPTSSIGSSPALSHGFAAPFIPAQSMSIIQPNPDDVVGPWDKINKATNAIPSIPNSGSQRSSSPPNSYSSPSNSQTPKNDENLLHNSEAPANNQHVENLEVDIQQRMDNLVLTTSNGTTSPQLPSPASGSSSSVRNTIDQNPPINTLYVGNLPTSPPPIGMPNDYLEESLRELFRTQPGYRRLCFRHKSNGPMCFVEFDGVQHATKAMADLYGNTLKGLVKGGGIRLSYSKNPLGVRTPTSANGNGPSLQQQQLQNLQTALGQDIDQPQQHRTILRREDTSHNNFIASPPPRFLPNQQGSTSFFGPSSPPFMRPNGGNLSAYSYSLAATSPGPFSPFGSKDHQHDTSIPEPASNTEEALH